MDRLVVELLIAVIVLGLGLMYGVRLGVRLESRGRARNDAFLLDEHEKLYATGVRPTLRALRGMRADDERAKREADAYNSSPAPGSADADLRR